MLLSLRMKRRIKRSSEIVTKIKKLLCSKNFMKRSKNSEKDFTRERKMPFIPLVVFMLNLVKQTLQKELTHFINIISKKDKNITKSAYSQSRMKLKHEAFIELNNLLIEEFYTDNYFKLWQEFRLLAVDGVKLQLPNSQSILQDFGGSNNGSRMVVPMAEASTCFDVLNEIIINSEISKQVDASAIGTTILEPLLEPPNSCKIDWLFGSCSFTPSTASNLNSCHN